MSLHCVAMAIRSTLCHSRGKNLEICNYTFSLRSVIVLASRFSQCGQQRAVPRAGLEGITQSSHLLAIRKGNKNWPRNVRATANRTHQPAANRVTDQEI